MALVDQDVAADGRIEVRRCVIRFGIVARELNIVESTLSGSLPRGIDDSLVTIDADYRTGGSDMLGREHRHIA
ncbi:hypothetical protein ACVWWN_004493 [Mycobacterium sp. URHB0021]